MVTRTIPALLLLAPVLATPAQAGETMSDGPAVAIGDHLVKVDGVRNFRDAGGYRTGDGHAVRRDVLYRAGSLGSITPAGRHDFAALHVGSIVDLRTTQERSHDAGDWLARQRGYWARDYDMSAGDMGRYLADPAHRTPAAMRAMMVEVYKRLPFEQAPAYKVLFVRLATPTPGAVVVNCTAGKDRTGVATALVLTALGVPYATVRADFLLSNDAVDPRELRGALRGGPLAGFSPEAAMPLLTVDGAYLDAAFAAIRAKHGSIDAYLREELGVGPAERAAIRARLLD